MVSALFAKLQWKGQVPVFVLDAPASFAPELAAMSDVRITTSEPSGDAQDMPFVLAFVTTRDRVADIATLVARCTSGDAVVWLAYPKLTSKRFSSELNRDKGWEPLRAAGFDTVRQVAIDDDWSALRFRRTAFIGSKKAP